MIQPHQEATTLFESVGGTATFERIVEHFYEGVATDSTLRPLYPDDLTESKRHLALFLIQYFGGPATYSQERGHPRLRMRHLPFEIGVAERNAWMRHMETAVKAEQLPTTLEDTMLAYFERAATFMINRPE